MHTFNPLIVKYTSGEIDKNEFINSYFKGNKPDATTVSNLLEEGLGNKDGNMIEEGVFLLFLFEFDPNPYRDTLCKLLTVSWHIKHEDIASLLKSIASPLTVNCLYNAACMKFEYLEYDDTYQFARKCIKALAAINTTEAIDKLKLLSEEFNQVVANYAVKELRYKGVF